MTFKYKYSFGLLLAGSALIMGTALPVYAEREPEVLYEVKELDQRDELQRIENARVNKILYDYLSKMEAVEKADNNVRYLVNQSSRYTDKDLQDYINNEILPRSSELLSMAGSITSRSSAIRECHAIFMRYITSRHEALVSLATYANKRVPRSMVSKYVSGFGVSYGGTYCTEERKSDQSYSVNAAMRNVIAAGEQTRNDYLNRREYIVRNKAEVIDVEK
ncbi:hypothetical protein IJT93_13280 [bacterium]|nr:hypothetical protein [bacterium]